MSNTTIQVTEAQNEVIEKAIEMLVHKISRMDFIDKHTQLDLITIARIVEGEKYETIRDFKIGDIAKRNDGRLVEIVSNLVATNHQTNSVLYANTFKHEFTLICKVENTEKAGK